MPLDQQIIAQIFQFLFHCKHFTFGIKIDFQQLDQTDQYLAGALVVLHIDQKTYCGQRII